MHLILLLLVFSLTLTVVSRLFHLYSTNDKKFNLKMKSFSTVRDTQRVTQSYMENRRVRREIEVTRSRRGGIKRGESKLASNQFPMCSPQSGSLRDVHRVTQRREEEQGDRDGQEDKRRESKGERQIQPVISSLCVLHHPEHTSDSQSWVEKRRGREETEVT